MKFAIVLVLILVSIFLITSCGYRSPKYVHLANEITTATAKKLRQEKNLQLIGTGGGMMNDIKMMAMGFRYLHIVSADTARELAVYAASEYLVQINNNANVRPYLHNYPFTVRNIQIRIWFFNPDGSDVPVGKIRFISVINGTVECDVKAQDKYKIEVLFEEPYEDALQKVQNQS